MAEKVYLFTSMAGVRHYMVTEGNETRFIAEGEVGDIFERNRQLANWNDGYSPTRELRRVATIPAVIGLKWLNEEGWWFQHAAHDPDVARKLAQKLNDPDYAYLRTAPGRVGYSNGSIR